MGSRATLARNLRRLRSLRGLNQEALAHATGLNRTYISDLECERSAATVDTLDRLARVLKVSPSDLIA